VQPQDGCLRSYELSDWDEALLGDADAVILAGRGLESFESLLSGGSIAVMGAMDGLTLINNGALAPEGDESDHFDDENPWAYLSVPQAREMCSVIAAGMIALDPDYEALYEENFAHYDEALEALETRAEELILAAPEASVAVAHEGLFYLTDWLGLSVASVVRREPGQRPLDNVLRRAGVPRESGRVILIESQRPRPAGRADGCGFRWRDRHLSTHAPGTRATTSGPWTKTPMPLRTRWRGRFLCSHEA
jgi:ABC-type Zn uptake system ZnuABC Zn-binding protein ZnuA